MKFACHVESQPDGRWRARASAAEIGEVEVTADDRSAVIEKLRGEIRYRLELCPCSGVGEQYVELEVR